MKTHDLIRAESLTISLLRHVIQATEYLPGDPNRIRMENAARDEVAALAKAFGLHPELQAVA